MAAFQYKLEYLKDDELPQDPAVFIHLRVNTPIYMTKIKKENYDIGTFKHDWMTGIFNIGGVVEAASQAYRVWLMKSPVFQWDEVIPPLIWFMADYLGLSPIQELPGSGITLNAVTDRRPTA
jgi:hypothetical protein